MFFLFSAKHCEPFFRFRAASWGLESEQGGRHIGEREKERERERRGFRQKEKEEVLPERWLHQISLSLSLDFLAIESPSASLFSPGKSSCNSKGG